MFFKKLILVFCYLLSQIIINSASAALPTDFNPIARPFKDSLCLGVKFAQGEPISHLSDLKELRVRWVREEYPWSELEPKPGVWRDNFSETFLKRLAFYKANHIGVIFLLGYGNAKAYPDDALRPANSIDPKRFANWAAHVALLLKNANVDFVLEILNEPHNHIRQQLGGNWQGEAPSPWVDHYARMVRETVATVHALDPDIKLLTDDDMWIIHYWFLEAGLPSDLNGFAIHPYTNKGDPEHTAVKFDTNWTKPFSVVDPDQSFGSAIRRLRERGKLKLGKTPEIWVTEWGWAVDGVTNSVTDRTLSAYLPRALILAAAAGVNTACWFSSYDAVDGPMGLTRNNDVRRETYYAFRVLADQFGDFTLTKHVFGAETPASGLQGFLFEKGKAKKLVVWNVEGKNTVIYLPDKQKNFIVFDSTGRRIYGDSTKIGVLKLEVGALPLYISGPLSF